MNRIVSGTSFLLASCIIIYGSYPARAATGLLVQDEHDRTSAAVWTSSQAQHVYGLPDTKSGDRGTLHLDAKGLSFAGRSADFSIGWHSIIALSADSEQVELWGWEGRIFRMLIPFSGGLAVAAITHHRVDELTVEFRDSRGGYHGAVFLLPGGEAERALGDFSQLADSHYESPHFDCEGQPVQPGSVLVQVLRQPGTAVPAAYRALVYEHLVDRLRKLHGVGTVYREGQDGNHGNCSQFNVQVDIAGFQRGNQVLRASTGPVGMFLAPTELKMDASFSDTFSGKCIQEHFKSTVRDDSESRKVTEKAASNLAKHFSSALRKVEEWRNGMMIRPMEVP